MFECCKISTNFAKNDNFQNGTPCKHSKSLALISLGFFCLSRPVKDKDVQFCLHQESKAKISQKSLQFSFC